MTASKHEGGGRGVADAAASGDNVAEMRAGLPQTPGYRYADARGTSLFLAGQVPLDGSGRVVGIGDAGAQATACLRNLRTVLEVHGRRMQDVGKLVVYVAGQRRDLLQAWESIVGWFDGSVPPATLLGIRMLGYEDQLVEIDATVEEAWPVSTGRVGEHDPDGG